MASPQSIVDEFQKKFDAMRDEIEDKALPLMRKAYECCVTCFNPPVNKDRLGDCIERCHSPLNEYNTVASQKTNTLMRSVQSCQELCLSKVDQKKFQTATPEEKQKIEAQLQECSSRCFVNLEPEIDNMRAAFNDVLNRLM